MKRALPFLLLLPLLAVLAAPAHAAIQQVRVMAVGNDRSSVKAQEKAMVYAKQRAVYLVARKLPVADVSEKLVDLTPQQWREIVRGATIQKTRRVKEITYAEVMVSVQDTALKRALDLPDEPVIDFTKQALTQRGVLLVPVYVEAGRPYVWEDENQLRDPLRTEVMRLAAGQVLIASGDLDDRRLIDYQNALTVTAAELGPMYERYGADEVIMAIFVQYNEERADPPSILLRRLLKNSSKKNVVRLGGLDGAKTNEARLRTAAAAIASAVAQIASSSADADRERLEKANKIAIWFRHANPRELARMQEAIRKQPGLLLLEIPAITLGEIRATAYYESPPEKLRENLRKEGIIVTGSDTDWQLSLR